MRLSELIEHLEQIRNELDDRDPEVRLTFQPNWPLLMGVGNVCVIDPNEEAIADVQSILSTQTLTEEERQEAEDELDRLKSTDEAYVTLADGDSHGYGSHDAWGS